MAGGSTASVCENGDVIGDDRHRDIMSCRVCVVDGADQLRHGVGQFVLSGVGKLMRFNE